MKRLRFKNIYIVYLLCIITAILFYKSYSFLCILSLMIVVAISMYNGKIKIKYGYIKLSSCDCVMILYSFLYISFGILINYSPPQYVVLRGVFNLLAFFWGARCLKKFKIDSVKNLILCIVIGFFITCFPSAVRYNSSYGNVVPLYWTGERFHLVNFNAYNVIAISLIPYALFYEEGKLRKLIVLAIGILSVYMSVHTAKRTAIVVGAVVFALVVILFCDIKKIACTLTAIMALGAYLIWGNAESLELTHRFQSSVVADNASGNTGFLDDRVAIWKLYFPKMFSQPFTGLQIDNIYTNYAHNMFLDIYIQHGIITMFILILFFLFHFHSIYILFKKNKNVKINDKIFFASVSVGLFLYEMTEPAYDAFPFLILLHFAICGYIEYLNKNYIIYK